MKTMFHGDVYFCSYCGEKLIEKTSDRSVWVECSKRFSFFGFRFDNRHDVYYVSERDNKFFDPVTGERVK